MFTYKTFYYLAGSAEKYSVKLARYAGETTATISSGVISVTPTSGDDRRPVAKSIQLSS